MSRSILYADADAERRTAVADALDATDRFSPVCVGSLRAAREQFAVQGMDAVVAGATLTDATSDDLAALARSVAPWLPLVLYAAEPPSDDSDVEAALAARYDAANLSPSAFADQLRLVVDEGETTPYAERELARLATLDGYDIPAATRLPFDRLTGLAADVLDAPVSFVGVITNHDHQLLGTTGIELDCLSRANSICTHGLHEASHLAVEDLLVDPRFTTLGELTQTGLRSYLGVPLRTPAGESLGMFCVMDTEPREYGASDVKRLRGFARTAMDMLALQRPDPLDSASGS